MKVHLLFLICLLPSFVLASEECSYPFVKIGTKCTYVDAYMENTWEAVAYYCEQLGGQIAVLSDRKQYRAVKKYLRKNGKQKYFKLTLFNRHFISQMSLPITGLERLNPLQMNRGRG